MTTTMWALVVRSTGYVIMTDHGYWSIINRFNCERAAIFYQRNPEWRIKRCTVTVE